MPCQWNVGIMTRMLSLSIALTKCQADGGKRSFASCVELYGLSNEAVAGHSICQILTIFFSSVAELHSHTVGSVQHKLASGRSKSEAISWRASWYRSVQEDKTSRSLHHHVWGSQRLFYPKYAGNASGRWIRYFHSCAWKQTLSYSYRFGLFLKSLLACKLHLHFRDPSLNCPAGNVLQVNLP